MRPGVCELCAAAERNPYAGRFSSACVQCMARLIRSARPVRRLQQAHIEALARWHGHAWAEVWPKVQDALKAGGGAQV